MEIKLLKNDAFTLSGSGVLRSFQNEKMPNLDLLIREAIQNSMDARRNDKNYVKEEINVQGFDVKSLLRFFPQIESQLYIKKMLGYDKYISISDKNTIGLTGPIRIKDIGETDWGRFLSLVQGVAKPQEAQGAGGSWGYGKTVYYRIGIGLVIFYSRIIEDGVYKNRLMACLVENEKNKDSILNNTKQYNEKTGVAWWGIKDEKYENNIVPLEDEEEIQEILNCFGLDVYEGDETGTSIIIPFVNEQKLLNNTSSSSTEDRDIPYWCKTLEDYLMFSVQKWYPTKIMNKELLGEYWGNSEDPKNVIPWLDLSINGEPFIKEEMLPLFDVMQELYNFAIKQGYESKYEIKQELLTIRNVLQKDKPVGKMVYASLTKEDLRMLEPENEESPYVQISNERVDDENNANVIIAFCRKPGMILRYSTNDEWTNSIVNPKEDTYIIALFVPYGYNEIEIKDRENARIYYIKLEEYLRATEEADHNNWTDIGNFNYGDKEKIDVSNLRVVWKIQKSIKQKLKEHLKEEEKEVTISVGTVLSRKLTKWFLPEKGFGNKAIKRKASEPSLSTISRTKKTKLELKSLEISEQNELYKRFILNICYQDLRLDYSFEVVSENGNIGANDWEKAASMKFPLEIIRMEIDNIIYDEGDIREVNFRLGENEIEGIHFDRKRTELSNTWYGFKMYIQEKGIINISGKIYYKSSDSNVEVNIEREKVNNNEQ